MIFVVKVKDKMLTTFETEPNQIQSFCIKHMISNTTYGSSLQQKLKICFSNYDVMPSENNLLEQFQIFVL